MYLNMGFARSLEQFVWVASPREAVGRRTERVEETEIL